jgi:hypothetical protein
MIPPSRVFHPHTQAFVELCPNLGLFAKPASETASSKAWTSSGPQFGLTSAERPPVTLKRSFFFSCRAELVVKGQKPRRDPASKTRLQSDEAFSRRRSEASKWVDHLGMHAQTPRLPPAGRFSGRLRWCGLPARARQGQCPDQASNTWKLPPSAPFRHLPGTRFRRLRRPTFEAFFEASKNGTRIRFLYPVQQKAHTPGFAFQMAFRSWDCRGLSTWPIPAGWGRAVAKARASGC